MHTHIHTHMHTHTHTHTHKHWRMHVHTHTHTRTHIHTHTHTCTHTTNTHPTQNLTFQSVTLVLWRRFFHESSWNAWCRAAPAWWWSWTKWWRRSETCPPIQTGKSKQKIVKEKKNSVGTIWQHSVGFHPQQKGQEKSLPQNQHSVLTQVLFWCLFHPCVSAVGCNFFSFFKPS